jgi:hypothetical protein
MSQDIEAMRGDPLSENGRAQHRNLLLVSTIGILVVLLNPTRISAVGIQIGEEKRSTIFVLLIIAIVYFAVAFSLAVSADHESWLTTYNAADELLVELNRELENYDQKLAGGHLRGMPT